MEQALIDYIDQYMKLEQAEIDILDSFELVKTYPKGHLLLREGQYAKENFFVLKGCVRTYYLKDGEEKTTGFYLEEESLIPESIVEQTASEYFIVCEEDSTLLVSTLGMEEEVFQKFPRFESLCRVLSEKELSKKQASLAFHIKSSPEERYQELQKKRPELLQRVPQYQIASFIGVKPETLSRIRKKMR
jgi:CRP-like cAMP-binding protein